MSDEVEAAKNAALIEQRDRMAGLCSAFPGEPNFVIDQYLTGATVDQARAAYITLLLGRVADLEAAVEMLGGPAMLEETRKRYRDRQGHEAAQLPDEDSVNTTDACADGMEMDRDGT